MRGEQCNLATVVRLVAQIPERTAVLVHAVPGRIHGLFIRGDRFMMSSDGVQAHSVLVAHLKHLRHVLGLRTRALGVREALVEQLRPVFVLAASVHHLPIKLVRDRRSGA